MTRGTLSVQEIALAGTTPSYSAGDAANGHQFVNDGQTFLHVKNTGGGACTVTLTTPATIGGVALADPTVSVPMTSGDKMIGPFDPSLFNNAGGLLYVDLSTSSGVTLAAIKLPRP
jgi:hypothetical protein